MSGTWYDPSEFDEFDLEVGKRDPNAPTDSADIFLGSAGADSADGLGDSDTLNGLGGNDTLYGNDGDDSILGYDGNDVVYGGTGDDRIHGGPDDDTLDGGEGNDIIVGSFDNDILYGGEGDDILLPGPGNDTIYGGEGNDTVEFFGTRTNFSWVSVSGGWLVTDNQGNQGTNFVADDVEWVYYSDDDEYFQVPCFLAGTRILTAQGEVPVEQLRIGELVVTLGLNGAFLRPVQWVGRRRIDLARHPAPSQVLPIIIKPSAIAPGVPHRRLLVSPDHALFLEGRLVPAGRLVNGETIVPCTDLRRLVYYHVELDRHDVILAEGMPAESYLDDGQRARFDNAGVLIALHPDFSRRKPLSACAPLVLAEHDLARMRAKLGRVGKDSSQRAHA